MAVPFIINVIMYEGSNISTLLPTLITFWFFGSSHLNECEVVVLIYLALMISDELMCFDNVVLYLL